MESLVSELEPVIGEDEEESDHPLKAQLEALKVLLNTNLEPETLNAKLIQSAQNAVKHIDEIADDQFIDLKKLLELWVKHEQSPHPADTVKNKLKQRLPQFILFDEQHRDLKAQYNLDQVLAPKNASFPPALKNLAKVARLDLAELDTARKSNDQGTIFELIKSANENLKHELKAVWSQSGVMVSFRLDGAELYLIAEDSRSLALDQRSTGLRQYLALFAFLASHADPGRDIVLLVDEAEQHLHYDAQADLVQTFSSQVLAAQVVYTTHSIGCLPEDFGLGMRTVETTENNWSEINNTFWDSPEDGLKPLLYGMGAATMAFLPVRCGVFTEGAVDMLLYPSLLREACDVQYLGFQFTPGLSEVDDDRLTILQREATKVAYIVDGDEGGRKLLPKLQRAQVDRRFIVDLKKINGKALEVEDFVHKEVYTCAVNEELERSSISQRLTEAEVADQLRSARLDEWCKKKEIKTPNKTAIAYRILGQVSEKRLVDRERVSELKNIYNQLESIFLPKGTS